MASINEFKARMLGGGARPSLFKVILSFPAFVADGAGAAVSGELLVNATQLPASRIAPVPVFFQGREVKFAGERTFDDWNITVLNDNDFQIRNAFERWMNGINTHAGNLGLLAPALYQTDMTVQQLDRNGLVMKTYKFVNCFPTSVSEIGLAFGDVNRIEEFGVTFALDFWTSNTTT